MLEAVALNKLPGFTSLQLELVNSMDDVVELLGAAAESGCLSAIKKLSFCNSKMSASGHVTLTKAMESGHLLEYSSCLKPI